MMSREWSVMTPGSSGDTTADHSSRSWWRGRSLHPRATSIITSPTHSPGRFFSHPPLPPSSFLFLLSLSLSLSLSSPLFSANLPWSSPRFLQSLSLSRTSSAWPTPLVFFSSSYSQMRSRGMSWLGPSCPPIIILTGFNLNNAACGFHRHARARLIISRTNSPTRYPSMVYHPTLPATIIFFPPASSSSSSSPVFPVTEDLRFSFLRASLALFSSSRGLGLYDPWIYFIAFICTLTLLQLAFSAFAASEKMFLLYVNERFKLRSYFWNYM